MRLARGQRYAGLPHIGALDAQHPRPRRSTQVRHLCRSFAPRVPDYRGRGALLFDHDRAFQSAIVDRAGARAFVDAVGLRDEAELARALGEYGLFPYFVDVTRALQPAYGGLGHVGDAEI